jgi:dihydrofolate reductase
VYLTRIEAAFVGDATFPPLDPGQWREVSREAHPPAGERAFGFAFIRLDRAP